MHKLLLLLFLGLFFSNEPYTVTLGKAPNCEGFNLCKISSTPSEQKNENDVLAYIEKLDEKHIQFSFTKKSINDKLFLKYFSTGTFLLDSEFEFTEELCDKLSIDRCTLKQGKYKIEDAYDRYLVVFGY